MSYSLPQSYFNSFEQDSYIINSTQTIPQIFTTLLQEAIQNQTNIVKLSEFENMEELCTNEYHSESCKCKMADYNQHDDCYEIKEETNAKTKKVHLESCDCMNCFTNRDAYILKTQKELEEKLKIQSMQRECLEKEKQETIRKEQEKQEKIEKRKNLIEKINKVVVEYNDQSTKCEKLLKTYNTEIVKFTQLNTEYYKLKYQLD